MSNASGDDEELKEAIRSFRNAIISEEYFNTADDAVQYEQASAARCTAQNRLESLFGRIKEERDGERALLKAALDEVRDLESELGRIREAAQADKERLDWLDTLGSFRVALNHHDGRQRDEDAGGKPVLLRLWLKDRSGENQSLRDALDELRPITEESVSGGALKEGATQ